MFLLLLFLSLGMCLVCGFCCWLVGWSVGRSVGRSTVEVSWIGRLDVLGSSFQFCPPPPCLRWGWKPWPPNEATSSARLLAETAPRLPSYLPQPLSLGGEGEFGGLKGQSVSAACAASSLLLVVFATWVPVGKKRESQIRMRKRVLSPDADFLVRLLRDPPCHLCHVCQVSSRDFHSIWGKNEAPWAAFYWVRVWGIPDRCGLLLDGAPRYPTIVLLLYSHCPRPAHLLRSTQTATSLFSYTICRVYTCH